jgi:hypothetical protein
MLDSFRDWNIIHTSTTQLEVNMSKVLQKLINSNPEIYDFMLDKVDGEPYEILLEAGYSVNGQHSIAGDTVKDVLLQATFIQKCDDNCVCHTDSW